MIRFKIALEIWLSKKIFIDSVKTAIFVGTILAFINHRDLIISGALTRECVMKMVLTCIVTYSVASWTAMKAEMASLKMTW